MKDTQSTLSAPRTARALGITAAALAVIAWPALASSAPSAAAASSRPGVSAQAKPSMSATLEQCVTSPEPAERSATFSGEMTAVPGTAKMGMRIEVLERQPGEAVFHTITAAGLGVWRTAVPGVKTYKYLKQVTNLAAPASYRAAIRFRWMNARGKVIRSAELRTPRCLQTVPPVEEPLTAQGPAKNA